MKRVQHNDIGYKLRKLDHVPLQNIDEFGDGMLGLLPNDVLEHLLVKYLSPADKSNLKLASKTCETRVMTLDRRHMRKWEIDIFDYKHYYKEIILPLMKAKMRHAASGNLDKIQLSVAFGRNFMFSDKQDLDRMLMYSDIVLNHWKDNITELEMSVCGAEFFLLEPTLKLSNLKSLTLMKYRHNYTANSELVDFGLKRVCSDFIEKHSDTLENLNLTGLDVELSRKLCLKKFESHGIDSSILLPVLKLCNKTLENLIWMRDDKSTEVEDPSFKDLHLKLKEFHTNLEINTIHVIKACKPTLKVLKLNDWESYNVAEEIGSVGLELKQFQADDCAIEPVINILKTSYSTIEDLKISDIFGETQHSRGLVLNRLSKLSIRNVCEELVHFLIESAKATLSELDLDAIKFRMPFNPKLPKLKILKWCEMCFMKLINLIEANKDSLEELEVEELQGNHLLDYNLHIPQLFLKKLTVYDHDSTQVASILIESSASTLRELELDRIDVGDEEEPNKIIQPQTTLSLTRLVAKYVKPKIFFPLLKSSSLTLQDLKLLQVPKLEDIDPVTDEDIPDISLNLSRMVGSYVGANVVKHILDSQQKPINVLILKNLI